MPKDSVEDLIQQLEDLQIRRALIAEEEVILVGKLKALQQNKTPSLKINNNSLSVGDKVYITNRIRHSTTNSVRERLGIVDSIDVNDPNRIYITTVTGFSTWRLRKNLKKISDQQWNNYINKHEL